jgi:hypothetical protein
MFVPQPKVWWYAGKPQQTASINLPGPTKSLIIWNK